MIAAEGLQDPTEDMTAEYYLFSPDVWVKQHGKLNMVHATKYSSFCYFKARMGKL